MKSPGLYGSVTPLKDLDPPTVKLAPDLHVSVAPGEVVDSPKLMPGLYVSVSPHVHMGVTVRQLMVETMVALLPVIFAAWFFFGPAALKMIAICATAAVVAEAAWQKMIGRPLQIADGSALLSGVLLGLVLSPEVPWWIGALGAVVAMIVGKQFYGGLGQNPFNAVLVGWAFIQLSYSAIMSSYPMPAPHWFLEPGEFLEYPPLEALKMDGVEALSGLPWQDLFYGNVPGAAGTTSILAALIGGTYLLARRIITWHIPVFFILSAWVFGFIFWKIDPEVYADPTLHILSGWIVLSAFFLAPERGSSPVTVPGMILFGIGCGVLTMIIRSWGTYVEGVPFAILLMNTMTPLLDRIRPRVVGRVKEIA